MSTRWDDYENRRICLLPIPRLRLGENKRDVGIYVSGGLFALGWWFFIDAVVCSSTSNEHKVTLTLVDWMSGIFSTLGLLFVNSIDKSLLVNDDFGYSSNISPWTPRFLLFIGFALMAGGLAGSVTVLILKYIIPEFEIYFGVAEVAQNTAIMLSSVVLWVAQNSEQSDYNYNYVL
ncbi:10009_t:CDS:2 [Ambispora gerdemannii]|uniref:10009_t:CDS:1 n=1 Tax=Ambispora gerdemannii TaxID=144530 RepID=A0A9N9FI70_9GLOM|nr:10009_t:CDS:2 [Ambispora gerdemannii]